MENSCKYEIEFTEECKNEIRKIYRYIREVLYNKKAADKLFDKLEDYLNSLKYSPRLYGKVIKYKETEKAYRKMVVNNYIVLYDINEEEKKIIIVHMFYGGSNYISKI